MTNCPVCQTPDKHQVQGAFHESLRVACRRCGNFELTEEAHQALQFHLEENPGLSPVISHAIRRMQKNGRSTFIDTQLLMRIVEETTLPHPREQADNLIRWLGSQAKSPDHQIEVEYVVLASIVGAYGADNVVYILQHLNSDDLITVKIEANSATLGLTFRGWNRFSELERTTAESDTAFMAMQYGDAELDQIFSDHLKPSVAQTGFELRRLDEKPAAGLIDDRLRVEIRNSRFLVVDLTHDNRGAYWEAGFAEGLGKPVIYMCKKKTFDERGTHFDTSHHHTVLWDENDVAPAMDELKATIRATLPTEAKMADD